MHDFESIMIEEVAGISSAKSFELILSALLIGLSTYSGVLTRVSQSILWKYIVSLILDQSV